MEEMNLRRTQSLIVSPATLPQSDSELPYGPELRGTNHCLISNAPARNSRQRNSN